ncbi:MAG: IucA/IucC family protein [Streptosporangiaceae bacterium]
MLLTASTVAADEATSLALLNCLIREVSGPHGRVRTDGDRVTVSLAGTTLSCRLLRPPHGPTLRIAPPYEAGGRDLAWDELAELVAAELERTTGLGNPEFLGQVRSSHTAMGLIHDRHQARTGYLGSEQALLSGHRFHPSPKARQGDPDDWLPYAPETGARFPMRWLEVEEDLLVGAGDLGPLAGPGLLPVHPWQWSLLRDRPVLRQALRSGRVRDLGERGAEAVATSSVRTLYLPDANVFAKFSLDVRITNCVRKNAWYELAAAPALTRLLKPIFGDALLGEPAYRTVRLADLGLHEGLGVILREGLRNPERMVLAGALTEPGGILPDRLAATDPVVWWEAYVRQVAPPVLAALLEHGVVLEPHLQNVLIELGEDGVPVRAVFRDLEGTKLLPGRFDLGGLPERVREAVTYDEERGWTRVAYCLFVNHLAEIAASVADCSGVPEAELWRAGHTVIADHTPPDDRLAALLAGAPLPAKANLLARWARSADRVAAYVPVTSPFSAQPPGRGAGAWSIM